MVVFIQSVKHRQKNTLLLKKRVKKKTREEKRFIILVDIYIYTHLCSISLFTHKLSSRQCR